MGAGRGVQIEPPQKPPGGASPVAGKRGPVWLEPDWRIYSELVPDWFSKSPLIPEGRRGSVRGRDPEQRTPEPRENG